MPGTCMNSLISQPVPSNGPGIIPVDSRVTSRPRRATLVMTVPGGGTGREELHVVTRGPSQVRVTGPLAPHADGFRAALDAQGFSPWSQMFYLHLLADISRWLDRHGLDASGLTDANASAFRQDRRSRGRARFRGRQGLALLLSFLRDAGATPPSAAAEPGDETGVLVAEFAGYLTDERGLRPQTVNLYSAAARRFLGSLPESGGGILAGLSADAVRSFVIAESSRRGTGSLKNSENGDTQSKSQHRQIKCDDRFGGDEVLWHGRDQRLQSSPGDEHAKQGRSHGYAQAFDHQQADQPGASRSQGSAQRKFLSPRRGPRQHQIGDVAARNQEQQAHGREHRVQGGFEAADDRITELSHLHGEVRRIVVRMNFGDPAGDHGQVGFGLLHCHLRLQAPQQKPDLPRLSKSGSGLRLRVFGHPQVRAKPGKARRHDADQCPTDSVQPKCAV